MQKNVFKLDGTVVLLKAIPAPTFKSSIAPSGGKVTVKNGATVKLTCKKNTAAKQEPVKFIFYENTNKITSNTTGADIATKGVLTVTASCFWKGKKIECTHYNRDAAKTDSPTTFTLEVTSDDVNFACTKPIVTTSSATSTRTLTTISADLIGGIVGGIFFFIIVVAVIIALHRLHKTNKLPDIFYKRRRSLVRSVDKPSCGSERGGVDNTSFNADSCEMKPNVNYESAGDMFTVGTGNDITPQGVTPGKTDVYTEVQPKWKRMESKEPETGETKQQNGSIGRPASGSDVKVDLANQAYNPYEFEGPTQLNDSAYELEQPLNNGVESGPPGRSAPVDNVDSQQYAVVNKPRRVPKGQVPAAPSAQPNGTVTENANQDIDNGNVDNGSNMVPPLENAEGNKPTSFIPGLTTAYADVEIGVSGAPSIQPEMLPKQETPEKETKKGKKKKKKKKEEDKEEDKKKDKKGKDKNKKNGLWSSDDVSDGRPKGDSCAVPMDNPSAGIYAEVSQTSVGQSGPVSGSQQVESDQMYDVLQRKGPKQRPAANVGVTDQTYESVNYKV